MKKIDISSLDRSNTGFPEQKQARSNALERVSDGVVSLNHELRYTYVNRQATEFLDTDAESLLGEHIWDRFPNTEGTKAQDAIERAIETGQTTSFERYNENFETWWEVRVHPDDTGATVCFNDITKKKERLYDLERADTLFQNAQEGLFVINVEDGGETLRVNQVNPAYETFSDTPAGELQGKTIREITNKTDGDAIREKYKECVQRRTSIEYEEYLSAFDSGSWWETRLAPVLVDDEVTQIVGSTRNITERKEREQRLQKFEQMIEHTGHAVFFTDVSGQIEYVNPAFEELTGYAAADALGETPQLLSSGEHDDSFFAALWETVLDGDVWTGEIVNERKDGTRFVANHTIAPVMDDSGDVTHFVAIYDDITDQKERERRLQTHELIVQAMNEVAFLVNEDKRIQFANDAALDYADVSLEAIKGIPIESVTEEMAAPDEDPQRFVDAITAVLKNEEPDVGEWVQEPDGSETLSLEFDLFLESVGEVCVEQRLVPVKLYGGERGVAVISRDVTTRRQKEEEIQTHLEQAQKVGHVGSWHLNIDTNDLQWSDECYRIFGLDPGTPMTYKWFLEMVHPEDREKVDEAWSEALKEGGYDIEHRIVVDGKTRWVQETAEVEFGCDGEPKSGIGVVRDITEQVQQTREIRAQKERYESLFENVRGAVVVTDLGGTITTCNPGFVDMFGYESGEIEGNNHNTITDESTDVEQLFKITESSQEALLLDYQKKSGQIFPGETGVLPLPTQNGDTGGYVVHIIDVSEEQANHEQLQVLSRVFRHNVKNDMNIIQGHAELIEQQGPDTVLSSTRKILKRSEKFVEMSKNNQRIIDLLTGSTEIVDTNLFQRIQQIISDVQAEYPAATVQTDLAAECWVSAPRGIDKAIRELVVNAIIHSDREHPIVDIELHVVDGMAELTVRDDGPGIPEQEWSVLMADSEINPLSHGTGLGLWFVKQVVRRSNGTLSLDTNDSGGADVIIRLPES